MTGRDYNMYLSVDAIETICVKKSYLIEIVLLKNFFIERKNLPNLFILNVTQKINLNKKLFMNLFLIVKLLFIHITLFKLRK